MSHDFSSPPVGLGPPLDGGSSIKPVGKSPPVFVGSSPPAFGLPPASVQEFTIDLFHQLVPLGVFLVLGMAVITLVPDAVNWRPNFRTPIDISWSLSMPIT